MSNDEFQSSDQAQPRRRLLRALAAAGSVFATGKMLPSQWTQPVVNQVVLPAHAQTSPPINTGRFRTQGRRSIGEADPGGSILDLFITPAYAAGGPIVVGNVAFDAIWDVGEKKADVCLAAISRGGGNATDERTLERMGDELEDFSFNVDGQTVDITNQRVTESRVLFKAANAGFENESSAEPDDSSCGDLFSRVNMVMQLEMSSPYPDDEDLA